MSNKLFWGSAWFLGGLVVLAFGVPLLGIWDASSFDPNLSLIPRGPSLRHLLGTDELGRDVLLRAIYGARVSLMVGIVSAGISVLFGTLYGLVSGYLGGWVDEVLMRVLDVMMAIPSIFLILSIQVILEPSIFNVIVVIGLTSWMGVARLVRAEVLSIKERMFVSAARARAIPEWRIMGLYVLPHALGPVIVAGTLGVGSAILTESVLSFLGLGVQPPFASWGNMLENSLGYIVDAPWLALVPGVLITCSVLAINFLGDGLRERFSPRDDYA